jgi:hypothetical protein
MVRLVSLGYCVCGSGDVLKEMVASNPACFLRWQGDLPMLRTFVKAAAYHSQEAEALELFCCTQEDSARFFRHEGVGIEIDHSR